MILRFGDVYIAGDRRALQVLRTKYSGLKPFNPAKLVASVCQREYAIAGFRYTTIDGLTVKIGLVSQRP